MKRINKILMDFKRGKVSKKIVYDELKKFPVEDLRFAKIDRHRQLRRGFPEVIYAKGKSIDEIVSLAKKILSENNVLLVTHANKKIYEKLKKVEPLLQYDNRAKLVYFTKEKKKKKKGFVVIATGGTSDIPVASEAKLTLELMGNKVETIYDIGVAGLHRLFKYITLFNKAAIIIVIAGMDGALASVISGLVSKPVIAVPTSVGYGANFRGIAPLLTMLNSCSPGVTVVNIDNGFGAGYFASLINR